MVLLRQQLPADHHRHCHQSSGIPENRNEQIYTAGRVIAIVGCILLLAISSILLVDNTNNPFLYFRF